MMSDSDYEFSALMELESDIVNEDLTDDGRFDYDQHYCESHPAYYCDSLFCETKEAEFKCPFKK